MMKSWKKMKKRSLHKLDVSVVFVKLITWNPSLGCVIKKS